jgi:hypothetical protein
MILAGESLALSSEDVACALVSEIKSDCDRADRVPATGGVLDAWDTSLGIIASVTTLQCRHTIKFGGESGEWSGRRTMLRVLPLRNTE